MQLSGDSQSAVTDVEAVGSIRETHLLVKSLIFCLYYVWWVNIKRTVIHLEYVIWIGVVVFVWFGFWCYI